MKLTITVILCLAVLYLVFILAPSILFYKIIFSKSRYKNADFEKLNEKNAYYAKYADRFSRAANFIYTLNKRNFEYTVSDGTLIRGAIYGDGGDKTAIFLHGYNTAPLNNFCLQAKLLYEQGFNIAFIYSRAHGGSGGTSAMGIKEQGDLAELVPYIKEQTGARQLLVYGMSMGCMTLAFACDKLDANAVKGIVLDCGFNSPYAQLKQEMIRRRLPVFLIIPLLTFFTRKFLKIDIKTSATPALAACKVPALFFHGEADATVPCAFGKENYLACGAEKYWYSVPGAEHTLCFPAGGEEAEQELLEFIKKYFK